MLDEIDRKILAILQENARTSNAEIARRVGIVPSAILERIRKLEKRGIIQGYSLRIKARALGYAMLVFVTIRTKGMPLQDIETAHLLAEIPEVQEVHCVAEEECYIVKMRVKDAEHLSYVMREKFGEIDNIVATRTTLVLETVKETLDVPLERDKK